MSPYHSYIFFDAESGIHAMPAAQLAKEKEAFARCVESHGVDTKVAAYATLGFKTGTRFMLHVNAASPDAMQRLLRDLLHTPLGVHLRVTYTLFGMTRPSQYSPAHPPKEAPSDAPHRYLIVYPFTKTIEWHLLPFDERRNIMKAHVDVGRKFTATVSQRLLYAFGIDDHEFIVSYYTDKLEDFQTLVMEMRGTESRRQTKSDTPIFLGIHMPLAEALSMI